MDTALGLVGLVVYITAMLVLAAGVTFVVVKLTPDRAKQAKDKPKADDGEAA